MIPANRHNPGQKTHKIPVRTRASHTWLTYSDLAFHLRLSRAGHRHRGPSLPPSQRGRRPRWADRDSPGGIGDGFCVDSEEWPPPGRRASGSGPARAATAQSATARRSRRRGELSADARTPGEWGPSSRRRTRRARCAEGHRTSMTQPLPAEMHEDPAKVLRVFFNPVVLGLDLLLLEEPQYVLLELS
jgi:hypothetical protein